MTKLISILVAPLLAAALTLFPAAGTAAVPTARVVHGDLDLASKAGRATFDRRLAAAMDKVCGRLDRSDLGEIASIAECRREVSQAAAQRVATLLAACETTGPVRGTD